MPVDTKYIAATALDYANVPKINRQVIASVHLENHDDEMFWDTLLPHPQGKHYNYIYESRISDHSQPVHGVSQCLRYKDYLSSTFFICIDSDLRHLLQEPNMDAAHYILQTYTYSWENHYCLSNQIQQRLQSLSPAAALRFDFQSFLQTLSRIAYTPFVYLLWGLKQNLITPSTIGKFHSCFPSQARADIFADNGKQLLESAQSSLQEFVCNPDFADIEIEQAKAHFRQLGLTAENTYLHLRGHNLFNLLNHIGSMLCSHYQINFETQILAPALQTAGYWEIDNIHEDIQQIIH